ncbi:helix-turn-helix transcriptional regulator [Deinococcus misasensis]|uniref:helix-turn-helix transcriptional regulator n=1 Tax=Deinococcus misasensis TaxID=392413 RepID=UPI000554F215|nr:helix-turn-helix transcriptional regulator [Deinococcus misasensis]
MKEAVGTKIKEMRENASLTQKELAVRLWGTDKNQSYISEIEAGKHSPSVNFLSEIAQALNCQVADLIPNLGMREDV